MKYAFKVWDQANDGKTVAVRVRDTEVLAELADAVAGSDAAAHWTSLHEYLTSAATAEDPPTPFVRVVDLLWLKEGLGVPAWSFAHDRHFRVLRTGDRRAEGGFASQGYVILPPCWTQALISHHKVPLWVRYLRGANHDLIVVLDE